MAVIINYTTLQTAVGDYLARSDLTTFIPNFVQNWEERFYRDPENWATWMESALNVTLAGNVAALPSDYLGLRVAYFSGGIALKRITLEMLYARYPRGQGSAGTPAFIARNRSQFEFGPEIQSGAVIGTYYAKPTNIRSAATDASTHHLIVHCPDLCLYGSLLEAEPFIKNDPRIMVWKAAWDLAIESYRMKFKDEMYSGSAPISVAM